ncbi:tryptophan synthase subunit alpha [Croceicoccus sp. F390]|uniref:Tryptophan synthase alpha chain n=1 Tax=Croceicoccus esteveae TaxID=3075597 RepID=A0ABU2ZJ94_9SPHN|nr:tryptophan synthase subunit alpha [Croceicoccus sp. F390]MDT0576669.1 tryptophan synthase subunit alpha [Croceicoccus sp. F390]
MTRLAEAFGKGRPVLICFLTAGYGDTAANLDAVVAGGADIVELGMPFTDPMADGPVIETANRHALANGITTAGIFAMAASFRKRHPGVPLVLMGYANPMLRRGAEWFASQAAQAGVDGVICVDVPPEEDEALGPALREAGVAPIRLATPTTDDKRLSVVLCGAEGFLYYVSVAGVTGREQAQATAIDEAVERLKKSTDLPVAVGFGVRTPEQAAMIARIADGVIVGSALVELIARDEAGAPAEIRRLAGALADAVHSAREDLA